MPDYRDFALKFDKPGSMEAQDMVEWAKYLDEVAKLNPTTFLESWGSGAFRIMEACKAQNAPEPKWSINGGFICVTFVRPVTDPMKTPVGMQLGLNLNQVRTKYEPS